MTEHGDERELPTGWVWKTLNDLGDWTGGGTPSKQNDAYWLGGTIPWVSPKDMKSDYIAASEDTITEEAVNESAAKLIPAGSVLFVTRSGILRHTLPVAVTRVEAAVNQDLKALTPTETVDPVYLMRFVQAYNREILHECSKDGTTVQSIETAKLHGYPIPLAPLAEQRRIVDAIEELFSDLDAGVQALHTVRRQLDRYRQSVLKAAVEGDLTRDWREQHGADAEPADALLDRILAERRTRWEADTRASYEAKGKTPPKGWQSRYKEPAAPDADDLPELPEGWVWANIDQVGQVQSGITKNKSKATAQYEEVPYLRVANVQRGYLDLEEVKTILAPKSKVQETLLRPGDILFNEGGDLDKLGRGWVWEGQLPYCSHQNHVFRVRLFLEQIQPKLVSWFGNTFGRYYFLDAGKQTTNLASINQSKLKAFPVPLPSLAEQEAIVEAVEERLSVVDAVAAEVDRQLARAGRLRRAILQHAFAGKLVPPDLVENAGDGEPESRTLGHQLTLDV